jgi:site-specific recombinase XerD
MSDRTAALDPPSSPLPATVAGTAVEASTTSPLHALAVAWLLGYSSERTRRAYRRDLEHFVAWCAGHNLDPLAVRRAHVDAHTEELRRAGAAPSTVARRLSALSSFYGYAVAEDVLDRNPLANVRRPRISLDVSATVGLDRDDARQLLTAAAADSPRTRALVALLLLDGLRVSEALAADVDDLGAARGHRTIRVTRKGANTATVPLAPATIDAVDAYLAGRSSGPIFTTGTGRRWAPSEAFRAVRRLAHTAGVTAAAQVSPHSLRHTFATIALDAGASLRDVQDAMGHADPRTTRRYDRARHSLDRHPTYAVAAYLAETA